MTMKFSSIKDLKLVCGCEGIDDLLVDKNGETTLGKLVGWMRAVEDRTSKSLPNYLKRCTVSSKVFITKEAVQEECLNDLLFCVNNLYIGWILTALSINQMVNGSRVRDLLSVVATESLSSSSTYKSTDDLVANFATRYNTPSDNLRAKFYTPVIPNENAILNEDAEPTTGVGNKKILEQPKDFRLLGGTVIDVSFNLGDSKNRQTITVPVLVSLQPNIIDASVAKEFFKVNFNPALWQRWFKVTTGEISFFKDFLFEMDMLNEKTSAIKADKTGQLKLLYEEQANGLSSWWLKLIGWRAERQNIASTIQIFTKPQFDQFCHETNCNFNRFDDRSKYFSKTFTMLVAVIDSQYNKIHMYIDGIDGVGEYMFSQLQNFTKPNQYDLTSVMRAFANTTTPRF